MVVGVVTQEQIEALDSVAERLQAQGLDEESGLLRGVLAELQGGRHEVSAAAAADILHLTPQTIRNWVRGGTLAGRRDPTGHFLVRLEGLEPAIRLGRLVPDIREGTHTDADIDSAIERVRARRRAQPTL